MNSIWKKLLKAYFSLNPTKLTSLKNFRKLRNPSFYSLLSIHIPKLEILGAATYPP